MAETIESRAWEDDVTLTTCDREPIHLLGRVQSFGFVIVATQERVVSHISENAADYVDRALDDWIGTPLKAIFSQKALHVLNNRLQTLVGPDAVERAFAIDLFDDGRLFDVAMHVSDAALIFDVEPADTNEKATAHVGFIRSVLQRLNASPNWDDMFERAIRAVAVLTGFDRIMIYRFSEDGSGEVIAERKRASMEPYLGLRYPASDIPRQARALYLRSTLRLISDVSDEGRPMTPATTVAGEPPDLSMSSLRAVSPIHLEYLRNMGVAATMSISLRVRGELWGLIACHHRSPRVLGQAVRTAAELFGDMFSFLIEQRLISNLRDDEAANRELHDDLMLRISGDGDFKRQFDVIADRIATAVRYDGIAFWVDGEFVQRGATPSKEQCMGLVRFLNTGASARVSAVSGLAEIYPAAADFQNQAAGVLALPISRSPRDYILLFRREIVRTVVWAGDPDKPVTVGPNGVRLTPRKSFEAWRQTVHGRCEPWSETEIQTAERLRVTLLQVVLRLSDEARRLQQSANERQELLIAELNHRVRNMFGLIQGLVRESADGIHSVSDFTKIVGGRIQALARAHDQINRQHWRGGSLIALIKVEGDAFAGQNDLAARVTVTGPDALLQPKAHTSLALVIHELMTNARKYGALSNKSGRVSIRIEEREDGAVRLEWREEGGPPVAPSFHEGFGSTVIRRCIPHDLGGDATVLFEISGLRADFVIPSCYVDAVREDGDAAASGENETSAPPQDGAAAAPPGGFEVDGPVLILEDNLLIAMEMEEGVAQLVAQSVHVASDADEALEILDEEPIAFAVLDVNLGVGTSETVAAALTERGLRFVFVTGYEAGTPLLDRYPNAAVIQKPLRTRELGRLMRFG